MSNLGKKQPFFKKYIVTIVMVPSIIGIHLAWSAMQKNRSLVPADEQIELPIVTMAKYWWQQLYGEKGAAVTADKTSTTSETTTK